MTQSANPQRQSFNAHAEYLFTRTARQKGCKKPQVGYFSSRWATKAYTWDGNQRFWKTDSLFLGFSEKGKASVNKLNKRPIPKDRQQQLDAIIRATLLGGLAAEPRELLSMLRHFPHIPQSFEHHALSAPFPFFYDSGTKKDVYFMILLLLDHRNFAHARASGTPRPNLHEMLVALKQSKGNDTISEAELSYHARLTAAQSNHRKIVSDLLGWYNLDDYPQLGLAGHRISLEEFIPGLPAGHFFSTKHHLEMAKEVSRNFFSLIDLAKDAGLLTDLHRGLVISPTEPLPDFFSAQLPGDINPGNFILTPHHNAIFVDPGRYHPPHTFSQTLLRLISYYWWHRSETGSETMLPLAPLFTEVCQHFGRGRGISLLKEFRITLGFFYGTPQQQLKERFPHCPVDMIGRHYAALYGQDPDQGGTQWISRGIQRGRLAYQRRLPLPLGDRSPEADVRYFFESATLPFHFEEKDLRAMRHELDVFLGHHTFGIHLKPTEISTELYLRRVGHSPRTYDPKQPGPNKPKIIFNKKLSRIIAPVGRDLLNSAFYFSPFPDPAIARLAFITAKMRETGRLSNDNFSDYLRSVLSIACVLYEFFQNDHQAPKSVAPVNRKA